MFYELEIVGETKTVEKVEAAFTFSHDLIKLTTKF